MLSKIAASLTSLDLVVTWRAAIFSFDAGGSHFPCLCLHRNHSYITFPKHGFPVPGKKSSYHPRVRRPELLFRPLEILHPDSQVKDPSLIDFDPPKSEPEQAAEPDVLYSTIDIETKGHDRAVLKSYETFLLTAAKHLNITVSKTKIGEPPYVLWRRTLLKSAHVHKSARVQYETRTYLRMIQIYHVTGSTADTYLEYIQRNLPEGVGMKVVRRQIIALPTNIRRPLAPTGDEPAEAS